MSFPKYLEYQDTGIAWIGQVPAHWTLYPLFAVLRERDERNTGNFESNVLSLSYGRIIRRDVESNHGLLPESFETYQVVNPSNMVLRLTDLQNDQRSLRVGMAPERGIITSAYVCLEATSKIDKTFAYQLLNMYDLHKVFYGLGGGVRQSMGFEDLKRLPIFLPPLAEQRAIAAFLDAETARIDALVAKQQALITTLQEKRRALISHVVTKGLDASAPMKDSGVPWLGAVPAHWEVVRFRHCCDITEGQIDPKDEHFNERILIAPNHVEPGTGRILYTETATEQGAISGKYLVRLGEIIYSKIRPALNKVCLSQGDWLCSADMYPIQVRSDLINEYLFYFLLSDPFVSLMIEESMRVAMPKINRETLTDCPIPVPPMDEQTAAVIYISQETAAIDTLIAKAQAFIVLSREHRTALIAAAVTGQIDVRGYRMEARP